MLHRASVEYLSVSTRFLGFARGAQQQSGCSPQLRDEEAACVLACRQQQAWRFAAKQFLEDCKFYEDYVYEDYVCTGLSKMSFIFAANREPRERGYLPNLPRCH